MEIYGEGRSQGSKWKRGDEGERDYSEGEEEKEDDKDDEGVERKAKHPKVGGSKWKVPQGTGKYYNPPCLPCKENGSRCEKQKKAWACCQCAVKKVACWQGQGEKRCNARDSGQEDSNEEPAMSNAEHLAWQHHARLRKGPDRKGKGKGKFLLSSSHPFLMTTQQKSQRKVPRNPPSNRMAMPNAELTRPESKPWRIIDRKSVV